MDTETTDKRKLPKKRYVVAGVLAAVVGAAAFLTVTSSAAPTDDALVEAPGAISGALETGSVSEIPEDVGPLPGVRDHDHDHGGSTATAQSSRVVWTGDEFLRLGSDGDTWVLERAEDGTTWEAEPANLDLEEGSFLVSFADQGDTLAALFVTHGLESSDYSIHTTTGDGVWTKQALPSDASGSYNGLLLLDETLVTFRTDFPAPVDPYELLSDAGVLLDQLETLCGFDIADDGSVEVLRCETSEPDDDVVAELSERLDNATDPEERAAISEELANLWELTEEVVLSVPTDDDLHGPLVEAFETTGETTFEVSPVVGPLTGPLVAGDPLPVEGFLDGFVSTDDTVFTHFTEFSERSGAATSVWSSTDGEVWEQQNTPDRSTGGALYEAAGALYISDFESGTVYVSTDDAETWAEADLESALLQTAVEITAGPAGTVALIQGIPAAEAAEAPSIPAVEKDDYTLDFAALGNSLVLTLPDGDVLTVTEELALSGDVADVFEIVPDTGEMIFRDAESGDELVRFTQEDFTEAFVAIDQIAANEGAGAALEFEVWTTQDGTTWTQIEAELAVAADVATPQNATAQLLAVGDDEVVLATTVFEGASHIEYTRVPLG